MVNIEMVSNSNSNHLEKLQKLFQDNVTDRLIIASPYLASDIKKLLNNFSFSQIKIVELITTFKAKDPEQLTKPQILKDFFDFFKDNYPNIKFKLHIDNELHGKLYFFMQANTQFLLLSSANFTNRGLCSNHEWGLLLKNNPEIDNILEDLYDSIEYQDVTYSQVNKACQFADQYQKDHPDWIKKPEIFSDILKTVYSVEDVSNTEPKYFLKPIGHKEAPVHLEEKRDFSELHQYIHFSKQPKGVKKGDIVITTAVGATSILCYFKVTGGLQQVTTEDIIKDKWKGRWPWYMEGRNQSPEFGKQWWYYNIRRDDALEEFKKAFPNTPVTFSGGFSLGTINFGNDKVQITKEFGEFLISKIMKKLKK
jgi:HKD family nuclease